MLWNFSKIHNIQSSGAEKSRTSICQDFNLMPPLSPISTVYKIQWCQNGVGPISKLSNDHKSYGISEAHDYRRQNFCTYPQNILNSKMLLIKFWVYAAIKMLKWIYSIWISIRKAIGGMFFFMTVADVRKTYNEKCTFCVIN